LKEKNTVPADNVINMESTWKGTTAVVGFLLGKERDYRQERHRPRIFLYVYTIFIFLFVAFNLGIQRGNTV